MKRRRRESRDEGMVRGGEWRRRHAGRGAHQVRQRERPGLVLSGNSVVIVVVRSVGAVSVVVVGGGRRVGRVTARRRRVAHGAVGGARRASGGGGSGAAFGGSSTTLRLSTALTNDGALAVLALIRALITGLAHALDGGEAWRLMRALGAGAARRTQARVLHGGAERGWKQWRVVRDGTSTERSGAKSGVRGRTKRSWREAKQLSRGRERERERKSTRAKHHELSARGRWRGEIAAGGESARQEAARSPGRRPRLGEKRERLARRGVRARAGREGTGGECGRGRAGGA